MCKASTSTSFNAGIPVAVRILHGGRQLQDFMFCKGERLDLLSNSIYEVEW